MAALYALANIFVNAPCAEYSPVHILARMEAKRTLIIRPGQIWWQMPDGPRWRVTATTQTTIRARQCNEWGVFRVRSREVELRRIIFGDARGLLYTGLEVISS